MQRATDTAIETLTVKLMSLLNCRGCDAKHRLQVSIMQFYLRYVSAHKIHAIYFLRGEQLLQLEDGCSERVERRIIGFIRSERERRDKPLPEGNTRKHASHENRGEENARHEEAQEG